MSVSLNMIYLFIIIFMLLIIIYIIYIKKRVEKFEIPSLDNIKKIGTIIQYDIYLEELLNKIYTDFYIERINIENLNDIDSVVNSFNNNKLSKDILEINIIKAYLLNNTQFINLNNIYNENIFNLQKQSIKSNCRSNFISTIQYLKNNKTLISNLQDIENILLNDLQDNIKRDYNTAIEIMYGYAINELTNINNSPFNNFNMSFKIYINNLNNNIHYKDQYNVIISNIRNKIITNINYDNIEYFKIMITKELGLLNNYKTKINEIFFELVNENNGTFIGELGNIDVNMRACSLYFTDSHYCDIYPELFKLSKIQLNILYSMNIIIFNNKTYTKNVIYDILNIKNTNNNLNICKINLGDNRLTEIKNYNDNQSNIFSNKLYENNSIVGNTNDVNLWGNCYYNLNEDEIRNNKPDDIIKSLISQYSIVNKDNKIYNNINCVSGCANTTNKFIPFQIKNMGDYTSSVMLDKTLNINENKLFMKINVDNNLIPLSITFVKFNSSTKEFQEYNNINVIDNIIKNIFYDITVTNGIISEIPKKINTNVYIFNFYTKKLYEMIINNIEILPDFFGFTVINYNRLVNDIDRNSKLINTINNCLNNDKLYQDKINCINLIIDNENDILLKDLNIQLNNIKIELNKYNNIESYNNDIVNDYKKKIVNILYIIDNIKATINMYNVKIENYSKEYDKKNNNEVKKLIDHISFLNKEIRNKAWYLSIRNEDYKRQIRDMENKLRNIKNIKISSIAILNNSINPYKIILKEKESILFSYYNYLDDFYRNKINVNNYYKKSLTDSKNNLDTKINNFNSIYYIKKINTITENYLIKLNTDDIKNKIKMSIKNISQTKLIISNDDSIYIELKDL